ncbi:MAG: phenylalanine 4-monooxygenase, partial [Terriglobales bacterium]
ASPACDHFIRQEWAAYTEEQHQIWQTLFQRRMAQLQTVACREYLEGAEVIGLSPDSIPELTLLNFKLKARTGWSAVPVSGFLDAAPFFQCLAGRRFPTTVTIRPMDQLEYLPEPDIFHDVFGHVPMHSDPVFADFLQLFGQVAAQAQDPAAVQAVTRLFWFTVEFGLIRQQDGMKVYGSGLISSMADCANALSPTCERKSFSLDKVLRQPFAIDQLQPVLYVVESVAQLFDAVAELKARMRDGMLGEIET